MAILGYNHHSNEKPIFVSNYKEYMPILKNAKKALRSSKRKAIVNSRVRSRMKTAVDAVKAASSVETISEAYSRIDRAVKHNLIHKNKAGRLKSQLSKLTA
ncbi:MAG: small subunit ribosomal protein [Patescibacteria group bacterium]|nr:small subunit ribosomal protein [Patescibacteria group bacterium]